MSLLLSPHKIQNPSKRRHQHQSERTGQTQQLGRSIARTPLASDSRQPSPVRIPSHRMLNCSFHDNLNRVANLPALDTGSTGRSATGPSHKTRVLLSFPVVRWRHGTVRVRSHTLAASLTADVRDNASTGRGTLVSQEVTSGTDVLQTGSCERVANSRDAGTRVQKGCE